MPAVGQRFREAREARGLTLAEVAEQIRIRAVYLDAIEKEDWSAIGAPVYIRGFLRTYARFLGLDAEEIVAAFNLGEGERGAIVPSRGDIADVERAGGKPSSPALAADLDRLARRHRPHRVRRLQRAHTSQAWANHCFPGHTNAHTHGRGDRNSRRDADSNSERRLKRVAERERIAGREPVAARDRFNACLDSTAQRPVLVARHG